MTLADQRRQTPVYRLLQRIDQYPHDKGDDPVAMELRGEIHEVCFEYVRGEGNG